MIIIVDDYNKKNYIQKILIFFCFLLKYKIYFINSKSNNISKKIKPLPLENIEWIKSQEDSDSDPNHKAFKNLKNLLTEKNRSKIVKIFENKISSNEIVTIIKRQLAWNYVNIVKKVDLFFEAQIANKKKKEKIYLLIFNEEYFLLPKFENNIHFYRLFFLEKINNLFYKICNKIVFFFKSSKIKILEKKYFHEEKLKKNDFNVFHILHDGIYYNSGINKWKKDYLDSKILKQKKIALIDYTKNWNLKDPNYFYISPKIFILRKFTGFKSLYKIFMYILNSKSMDEFFVLIYFYRLLLIKKFYTLKLSQFKNVKFAIIDYIELCPFPIILALKDLNIKTIGIQQRFINFKYSYFQIFVDIYLVNSELIKNELKKNKNIKHIIVVGQWRTKFLKKKRINLNKKIKRITALMYFYWMNHIYSQPQITVNDKSSDYFLDQLIKLSKQLENIEIFLKFKIIDWPKNNLVEENYSIQRFLNKLRQNKKIKLETNLNSYESCLISNLVIAKPTSLCDELLSTKIPTLISLDSHNFKIKKDFTYNYFHKNILVSSYNDLLFKTKRILMNDNYYKSIYLNSCNKLYDKGIFNSTNKLTNEIIKIIDK